MADPKIPFWKKGIQGVFTTKNPIPSTRTPNPLAGVITPEKTITFEGQKQTFEQMKQIYKDRGVRVSEKDLKTTFTNSWKQEQGTYKRATPKRQPINYYKSARKTTFDTMEQVSKFMKAKPKLTLAAKAIKIGKSLSPWGLAGTTLLYAASKAYDPERVKKSKTKWGIK